MANQKIIETKSQIVDEIANVAIWTRKLSQKKLKHIEINAPTPYQNTRKPSVAISIIKHIPASISHHVHISIFSPPFSYNIHTIKLYNKL